MYSDREDAGRVVGGQQETDVCYWDTHRDDAKVSTKPRREGRIGEQRRRAVVLHRLRNIPVQRGRVDGAQTLLLVPDEMAAFPGLRRAGRG